MTVDATRRLSLLVEIARCPVMRDCLDGTSVGACSKVVRFPWRDALADEIGSWWERKHHLPVPWVGHIDQAPILFVSSNPSLDGFVEAGGPEPSAEAPLTALAGRSSADHPSLLRPFQAPKAFWDDAEITDAYEAAFDVWIEDGIRPRLPADRPRPRPVQFWRAVKGIAESIIPGARPGSDYALTEVVHCRSRGEAGVGQALHECVERYLSRVLAVSPARVIVALGRPARNALRTNYGYPDATVVSRPLQDGETERRLVFLAHPNARGNKRPKVLTADEARELTSWLATTR